MFLIEWKESAIKQLEKLPHLLGRRIYTKVSQLIEDPFSKGIIKVKGEETFRLRVGDYRVLFDLDVKGKRIRILKVGHRKNIYK